MKSSGKLKALAAFAGLAIASGAMAQGTSFATATVHSSGSTVPGTFTAATLGTEALFTTLLRQQRTSGTFNDHLITGLGAGLATRAAMRQSANPGGGLDATWDSYMRLRDSANTTTLASNDDDGPGTMSAMVPGNTISAPANGQLRVQITGYDDNATYTGADTDNTGFYDLDVFQQPILTAGASVRWYRYEGVSGLISAEVLSASGATNDTMLMLFDSSGAVIGSDDDDGTGNLSAIFASDNILAPMDGVVYAAITYYRSPLGSFTDPAYYDNIASNSVTGSFTFNLVPAPGSAALLGLGGLLAARRRRA